MIEPDRRHVDAPRGQMHQPRREPGAADLDQVRPLVRDDPARRPGRQHEPVRLLRGHRRPVQAIAAHAARLEDLVARAGDDDRLPQLRPPLDVARLLEQVGPDAAGGLAEELGDVEHAERRARPEPRRELDAGNVQRRPGARRGDHLEVRHPAGGRVSQSNPRAGRRFRSWGTGSCSHGPGRGPRSRSDYRRSGGQAGGRSGQSDGRRQSDRRPSDRRPSDRLTA